MTANRQYIDLLLTCADKPEADKIARALLEAKLIACAKQLPVGSDFLWHGAVDHNDEILLVMESAADLFDAVEAKVAELHSYDTFVLQAVPFVRVSSKATTWLEENLQNLPKN